MKGRDEKQFLPFNSFASIRIQVKDEFLEKKFSSLLQPFHDGSFDFTIFWIHFCSPLTFFSLHHAITQFDNE